MTAGREGAVLRVRVQPRASRSEIVGWREKDVLAVRVAAPPLDGEANHAVRELLAGALGVPRASVSVARGERSRDKLVRVTGLDAGELQARLARIAVGAGGRQRSSAPEGARP